ncbi:MAG: 50S ribosomal protein L9 [Spirochaetales bacterium]|nr:50S ribosomal protein L9 [Spirochaetales bacterium]
MKVILNTDIANLGEEGDVLEVKPGYARNYLLPQNLVMIHNKSNLAILEGKRAQIAKRKEERRLVAQSEKAKLDDTLVEFTMPAGENGKLFGAVTAQMVVEELEKHDLHIERKRVEIPGHTLKTIGDFKIKVRLYNDASADLKVKIHSEDGKAEKAEKALAPAELIKPVVEENITEDTTDEE